MGGAELERGDQAGKVIGQLFHAVGRRGGRGPAVAAHIVAQQAVARGQGRGLRLPHA